MLEILEQKVNDEIRKVLCKPEMLKQVFQCILQLKQSDQTDQSREFGVFCAKVIAFIGLCLPILNDPILLKATNQQTLKQNEFEEEKEAEKINVPQSVRLNPITNMRYNVSVVENTLEMLAVPSLSSLPLERESPIIFAQKLNEIIEELTQVNEEKPKSYYFTQFLLQRFIKNESNNQKENLRAEVLSKAINRFSKIGQTGKDLITYQQVPALYNLVIYLIYSIEDKKWQQVFEACIPLVKLKSQGEEFIKLILPYLIYFTVRNIQDENETKISDQISEYLNQILQSTVRYQIELTLFMLDFLKIAIIQDKQIFQQFLQKEQNSDVQNFLNLLNQNQDIKRSFLSVKKLEKLLASIDRDSRTKAAKLVQNLKRCLFNMEDTYRQTILQSQNQNFMQDLHQQDYIELVKIQKQLMPEEFDNKLFNQIVASQQNEQPIQVLQLTKNDPVSILKKQIEQMFQNKQAIQYWKQSNWTELNKWVGTFDLKDIFKFGRQLPTGLLRIEVEDKKQEFELILGLLLQEYYKCSQWLLNANHFNDQDDYYRLYMESLKKVKQFIEFLEFEFIYNLQQQQGETKSMFKLFLHVLYEIETAIYFLKDLFIHDGDQISECLRREVVRENKKFEKVYNEVILNSQFEKLLGWFQERSAPIQTNSESMQLIYYVRLVIFNIYDRENEYAFYLMKIAKLHRKLNQDVIMVNKYYKDCKALAHKIIDFEYEYAKYTVYVRNANEAYQYLHKEMDNIQKKQDQMQKSIGAEFMPKLIYKKAKLLELELLIKIDQRNPDIYNQFLEFVKNIDKYPWEKPNFLFAQYIDMLERSQTQIEQQLKTPEEHSKHAEERKNRLIQTITYFMKSIQHGHKYIWQSLPRALELWFEFKDDKDNKITILMKKELKELESYKIATVLQLLLSRFGHERTEVRSTIVDILGQLAVQYPEHSAWWIYHFHFFEEQSSKHAITRKVFSAEIIRKIYELNQDAHRKIKKSETIFGDLKKLSEKETNRGNESIDMPKSLSGIQVTTNLVMPIQDNLTPQMPPLKYNAEFQIRSLVQTSLLITQFNSENLKIYPVFQGEKQTQFPAYKPNPIKIQGFIPKITIMPSKEQPKKIGVIGTDGKVYYFLLKCDKQGDLRKEQRFIDFAMQCNKIFEQDSDSRQRGLILRTYSIVPLSRQTALIEWVQNTNTLKAVVTDEWKRQNIKGEMLDIKMMALKAGKGQNHQLIWQQVKKEIKPVLASWFTEHFPSPDLWYEARANFIKSTALWSMVGYIIGLGDRHGDNILIHQHTGEVTHVDYDVIFEKGTKLNVPEIVPFRLTSNIMDAFGIFKEKGIFQKCSEIVLRVMRKNQKNIISYLESSFKNDPLVESTTQINFKIDYALEEIERKLAGNMNIGNGSALTIEDQVEQIILQAINDDNLRKMYWGWMPWL